MIKKKKTPKTIKMPNVQRTFISESNALAEHIDMDRKELEVKLEKALAVKDCTDAKKKKLQAAHDEAIEALMREHEAAYEKLRKELC